MPVEVVKRQKRQYFAIGKECDFLGIECSEKWWRQIGIESVGSSDGKD